MAEEAAQLITVEDEELPAVFDELAAMQSDMQVHEVLRLAGTFRSNTSLGRKGTNVALDFHFRRRVAVKAFAEAHHVIEHSLHAPACCTHRLSRTSRRGRRDDG